MTARTCTVWCSHHDYEAGVCFATPIDLRFTKDPDVRGAADGASFDLASSADGTTVIAAIGDTHGVSLTLDAAERAAYALLAQVATARGLTQVAKRNRSLATAAEFVMGQAPGDDGVEPAATPVRAAVEALAATVWVPAPRTADVRSEVAR